MASEFTPANSSETQELAELRLLHLADSALPIGSLAHSFGLETLVSSQFLRAGDIPAFLHGYLEEAGLVDGVFCRAAFSLAAPGAFSLEKWLDLNGGLSARKPAREARSASSVLGRNFLRAVAAVANHPLLREALDAAVNLSLDGTGSVHHATAFGLAAGALGFHEDRAVCAYLHQSVANLISAFQRLLPLGHTDAMRILWNLKPAILSTARRSVSCSLDDAGSFMPLLDWGAMEHPALSTRLFIS